MVQSDFLFKKTSVTNLILIVPVLLALVGATVNAEEHDVDIIAGKNINQYLDEISEIEKTRGPHDIAISENLVGLSQAYKELGDHVNRLDALNQALHIHRLNYGLESEEQFGIIEQIISTNTELRDWMALDKSYEYFYWVSRRVYGTDSLELLPALNRIMEWKLMVLKKGLFGHPEIIKHEATDLLRKIRKVKKINAIDA